MAWRRSRYTANQATRLIVNESMNEAIQWIKKLNDHDDRIMERDERLIQEDIDNIERKETN